MNTTTLALAKMQSQKIEAGHTYFIGASDSPKLLLVLAVDERRVVVVNPHGETMKSYGLDRREAELLAARGERTMLAKAERMAGLYAQHGRAQAALHGAPAKPRDFDLYSVSLRPSPASGMVTQIGERRKSTGMLAETSRRSCWT